MRKRPRSKSAEDDDALIRHAYHEAGHVVVCELLGRRVQSAMAVKQTLLQTTLIECDSECSSLVTRRRLCDESDSGAK